LLNRRPIANSFWHVWQMPKPGRLDLLGQCVVAAPNADAGIRFGRRALVDPPGIRIGKNPHALPANSG
jgi:hypothetical protein